MDTRNPRLRDPAIVAFLDRHAFDRAEAALGRWLVDHPDDLYAHHEFIQCFHEPRSRSCRQNVCNAFYATQFRSGLSGGIRHFVRAEHFAATRDSAPAIMAYQSALAEGMDVPMVRHRLAVTYHDAGRVSEAFGEWETALNQEPALLPARTAYAGALLTEGRFDRLETLHLTCPSRVPKDCFAGMADGQAAIERGARAAVRLRRAIRLLNAGRSWAAIEGLWPVFLDHPENCPLIRTVVYLFYRGGLLLLGQKRISQVVIKGSPTAHYVEGLFQWYSDEETKAHKAFTAALDAGLDHPLVYYARSLVCLPGLPKEDAQRDLLLAGNRHPWLARIRCERGQRAFERCDYASVLELGRISEMDRRHAQTYEVTGTQSLTNLESLILRVLCRQNRVAEAVLRIQEDKEPDRQGRLSLVRGMVYAVAGNFPAMSQELATILDANTDVIDEASDDEIRAIQRGAENLQASVGSVVLLALRMAAEGHREAACRSLEDLRSRFPDDFHVHLHLGSLLADMNERDKAKQPLTKAMSLRPHDDRPVERLCQLLKDEGDLQGLLDLADQRPARRVPLKYALPLAFARENRAVVRTILPRMARWREESHFDLDFIVGAYQIKEIGLNEVKAMLAQFLALDFESRGSLARLLIQEGAWNEGLREFEGQIDRFGNRNLGMLEVYGLSFLQIHHDPKKKE